MDLIAKITNNRVMQNTDWYNSLAKPLFTPPDQAFMIVWPVLYTMMVVSLFFIARKEPGAEKAKAILIFSVQFLLNLAWSPVFFGAKSPVGALVVLICLLFFLFYTIFLFYKQSKAAAFLLVPYALWCVFALYLNIGIVLLN